MNYLFVSIIVVVAIAAFLAGYITPKPHKIDGYLEVTRDSKSIFTFDPTIEPEELATRDWIEIKVVRRGPEVS